MSSSKSKKNSPSNSEYEQVLGKILNIARDTYRFWNDTNFTPLHLLTAEICEQDGDYIHYGLMNTGSGISFCRAMGKIETPWRHTNGNRISIEMFVGELQRYKILPEKLKHYFLREMEPRLRRYEEKKAGIDIKVKERLRALEQELLR